MTCRPKHNSTENRAIYSPTVCVGAPKLIIKIPILSSSRKKNLHSTSLSKGRDWLWSVGYTSFYVEEGRGGVLSKHNFYVDLEKLAKFFP